jgi:hypothetical protein
MGGKTFVARCTLHVARKLFSEVGLKFFAGKYVGGWLIDLREVASFTFYAARGLSMCGVTTSNWQILRLGLRMTYRFGV